MNMKLLIVDDDLPFRERLTRSMEKKGFEVISSPGFNDSLSKVNENNFDFAVVDMRLEDGSGLELVKELKKISPQTKSLLLTSKPLAKPFIAESLASNLGPLLLIDISFDFKSMPSTHKVSLIGLQ